MQVLLTSYTMYFNKRRDHVGHVFQGRFKSIIADKEAYLLQLIRYILRNPINAGIVSKPSLHPWSSYHHYVSNSVQQIIDTQAVLELLSENPSHQIPIFKKLVDEDDQGTKFDPEKDNVRGILGNMKFSEYITRVSKGVRP